MQRRPTRRGAGAIRASRTASSRSIVEERDDDRRPRARAIGQINALTVHDIGDRRFGTPVRVSARASVGRAGIVNIERDVALGGPIQQKGAMVLQGFLAGCFAQARPLSFTCSITFEQSYGGVEGDSASMAELIAVLSDLAQVPVRQDLAITGSVNQAGHAQPIGGAYSKIEGFFRVCSAKPGGLTGKASSCPRPTARISCWMTRSPRRSPRAGSILCVVTVQEAAELMLGLPAATPTRAAIIRLTPCSAASPRGSPNSTASSPSAWAPGLARPRGRAGGE